MTRANPNELPALTAKQLSDALDDVVECIMDNGEYPWFHNRVNSAATRRFDLREFIEDEVPVVDLRDLYLDVICGCAENRLAKERDYMEIRLRTFLADHAIVRAHASDLAQQEREDGNGDAEYDARCAREDDNREKS